MNAQRLGRNVTRLLAVQPAASSSLYQRGRVIVDDRLKELLQQLGSAINESLSESEDIAEAIAEIRRAGYDVFLVLEATIGFNKRPQEEGSRTVSQAPSAQVRPSQISFTAQDHAFLKALKIIVQE